jgi:hypothetical protein
VKFAFVARYRPVWPTRMMCRLLENPEENPYLIHDENRKLFESRYADVAFALSNT